MAQPAGISGWALIMALKIFPAATVVVAISSSQGSSSPPGTETQIGFVPSRGCLPCHGGTSADALHMTMPIWSAPDILCPQHAAPPTPLDSPATPTPPPAPLPLPPTSPH